jgi:hypothetical protein
MTSLTFTAIPFPAVKHDLGRSCCRKSASDRAPRRKHTLIAVFTQGGNYEITSGKVVGLFVALLFLHGILVGGLHFSDRCYIGLSWDGRPARGQNSLATRHLARFTQGFVFVNLGTTFRTCCRYPPMKPNIGASRAFVPQ